MKSRNQYAKYTPEIIEKLRKEAAGLPRVEGVKAVGKLLKLSPRQSRSVYSRFVEGQVNRKTKKVKPAQIVEPRKIRRLFWDIEVSPDIVLSWSTGYKLNIDYDSIIQERAIICIAYRWQGENQTHVLRWDNNQNDKKMLEEFLGIISKADEAVHHNGDVFDLPWFRTRCLFHGLQPPSELKTADTLQWARRKFYFNSNKLDYIAKFLGLGGKIKTGYDLWKKIVLDKDQEALDKMCVYCCRDVELLEKVWEKLQRFVAPKTHVGVLAGGERWQCPRTGSINVKVSKTRVTASGTIQYQFQNLDDGTYYTVGAAAYAAYLAAKGR